jgi:hypothetical protein
VIGSSETLDETEEEDWEEVADVAPEEALGEESEALALGDDESETLVLEEGESEEEVGREEAEEAAGVAQALKRKKNAPKRRAKGLASEPFFIRHHPAAKETRTGYDKGRSLKKQPQAQKNGVLQGIMKKRQGCLPPPLLPSIPYWMPTKRLS